MKLKSSQTLKNTHHLVVGCPGPGDDGHSLGFPSSRTETSIQGQEVYLEGEENTRREVGKWSR